MTADAIRYQVCDALDDAADLAVRLVGTFRLRPELVPVDATSLADLEVAIKRLERIEALAMARAKGGGE